MHIVETKIFRVYLNKNEDIEQAKQRLLDIGYRVIEAERIDEGGSLNNGAMWEIKVSLPWGKVL